MNVTKLTEVLYNRYNECVSYEIADNEVSNSIMLEDYGMNFALGLMKSMESLRIRKEIIQSSIEELAQLLYDYSID